jgi:hypothetical protein
VRPGGAAGRLIQPGDRERREQRIAPCPLLLSDRYCGSVCLLRESGIGGIELEQDVAAQAVEV